MNRNPHLSHRLPQMLLAFCAFGVMPLAAADGASDYLQPPILGWHELPKAVAPAAVAPTASVASVVGSHARLRPEPAPETRTVSSWLRDAWALGRPISVLDVTGEWHHGAVVSVASDHVVLAVQDVLVTVPYAAVEVWQT